ncbi:MAG: ORF6N domain-containing protein [bacterium]|nr:ORF6N domain-containing protein [bacterium]
MSNVIPIDKIESKILLIRGQKVMLDRDLAMLYDVETRELNQAVKRNIERFPKDFMFQLSEFEVNNMVSQNVIPSSRSQFVTLNTENTENKGKTENLKSQIVTSSWGGRRKLPYVFTEQGIAMLSSVLKSEKAIEVNIAIMRIFVNIRKFVSSYEGLAMKIAEIEKKYDKKIYEIFKILDYLIKGDEKERKDKKEIGFKAK